MTKVAIFTEGQTELLLMCEAIRQLAGEAKYFIKSERKNGKGDNLIRIQVDQIGDLVGHEIYFQILNCDSDEQVLSTLREEYGSLVNAGFSHIMGVRDLRPHPIAKLQTILNKTGALLPEGAVIPTLTIAVMETESWLIAENSHFLKIDAILTPQKIFEEIGIDITGNSETLETPYETIQQIYQIAGKSYTKSRSDLQKTVSALDIKEFKGAAGARAPSIAPVIGDLEAIFG